MSELEIIKNGGSDVVIVEDPEYVNVLLNTNNVAVDGDVHKNVESVEFLDKDEQSDASEGD
jgi:hypothetical protein